MITFLYVLGYFFKITYPDTFLSLMLQSPDNKMKPNTSKLCEACTRSVLSGTTGSLHFEAGRVTMERVIVGRGGCLDKVAVVLCNITLSDMKKGEV